MLNRALGFSFDGLRAPGTTNEAPHENYSPDPPSHQPAPRGIPTSDAPQSFEECLTAALKFLQELLGPGAQRDKLILTFHRFRAEMVDGLNEARGCHRVELVKRREQIYQACRNADAGLEQAQARAGAANGDLNASLEQLSLANQKLRAAESRPIGKTRFPTRSELRDRDAVLAPIRAEVDRWKTRVAGDRSAIVQRDGEVRTAKAVMGRLERTLAELDGELSNAGYTTSSGLVVTPRKF